MLGKVPHILQDPGPAGTPQALVRTTASAAAQPGSIPAELCGSICLQRIPSASSRSSLRELRAARLLPEQGRDLCDAQRCCIFTALTSLKYPDMDPFKQSATSRRSCSRAERGKRERL